MDHTGTKPDTTLQNDFRAQVQGGWDAVDPAIRARMDRLLTSVTATTFTGVGCVRRSRLGWCFAQLSRFLGAPLVAGQGEAVRTIVRIAPTANGLRCWHRTFHFEDGSQQRVQTTKLVHPTLGLLDVVGAQGEKRLTTRMVVWTDGKSLHFSSTGYLLRAGRFYLPIPGLITPGRLLAEHRDIGGGKFVYILKFEHPLWGETFYQEGIFQMHDEAGDEPAINPERCENRDA